MVKLSPSFSKQEINYLNILKQHPDRVLIAEENAPREGFEYFASDDYRKKIGRHGSLLTDKFSAMPLKHIPRLLKIMAKNVRGIFKARRESFTDIAKYLTQLEAVGTGHITSNQYLKSYPNADIWQSLSNYAMEKWSIKIGFTQVPSELIFKNKAILFRYAVVAIQEMKKGKIDTAPALDAGEEVLAVYNALGLAVNDIARWLRKEYGIRCQANHPLGGLVNTVPLAVKAGLGWVGSNGLLITPEFGPRQRIAPIFVEAPIFKVTDSDQHRWIETYCAICHRCEKACPTGAILEQKIFRTEKIEGVGLIRTSIEQEKCYAYFNQSLGCSICVKVCPFSKSNGTYKHLKQVIENRK
jgi:ferredoxin